MGSEKNIKRKKEERKRPLVGRGLSLRGPGTRKKKLHEEVGKSNKSSDVNARINRAG